MFTSLNIKSSSSLLQSPHTVEQYLVFAKSKGYTTVVLNEEKTLASAVTFYQLAKQLELKPILALSFTIQDIAVSAFALNEKGYFELVDLSSTLLCENGKIDLTQYKHLAYTVNQMDERGIALADKLKQGVNCPVYLMQSDVSTATQEIKKRVNVPVLLSKPVAYLTPSELSTLKVLRSIDQNTTLTLDNLMVSGSDFLLEANEYYNWCLQDEDAFQLTQTFLNDIDLMIPLDQQLLPEFSTHADEKLKELAFLGLKERGLYKDNYIQRLEKELAIIKNMRFSNYFLIVWDLMAYAHQNHIMTGAGRGSSAASLVSYCLRITNVDPVKYNLLFERFLNPQRYTMPDIDLDFPDNRRYDMLQYAAKKYGQNNVAQIATFGTFAPRQAIRDVARVFGATTQELKAWATAVGQVSSLSQCGKALDEMAKKTPRHEKIVELAKAIEGLPRHLSTHAAGVVISDKVLQTVIPVQQHDNQLLLTQFDMNDVQKIGLLKMDFLGLKNLSILADAQNAVQQIEPNFDIWAIDFEDQATLKLFASGQTDGVFQFESAGIKRALRQIKPANLQEVAAANALYRPGPMEQIPTFVKHKNKQEPIRYLHDDLQDILHDTQGIIVYQEQIMLIANRMAGYSMGQADLLRRAIAKMDKQGMASEKERFISGFLSNGYSQQTADKVFAYIEKFASYGFPKSHAFAYSILAYQLAYLKAHYPQAFYLALLLHTNPKSDRYMTYITQARQHRVTFLLPNINESEYAHRILSNEHILFGLSAIQGVRYNMIASILSDRKANGHFSSLDDFVQRLEDQFTKVELIEPFIYAGCFDCFNETRATLIHRLPNLLEDRQFLGGGLLPLKKTTLAEFDDTVVVEKERQYLGFSLKNQMNEDVLMFYDNGMLQKSIDVQENDVVHFIGVIKNIRKITTKNHKRMAFATFEDPFGIVQLTLFPEVYQKVLSILDNQQSVYIQGKIQKDQQGDLVCVVNRMTLKEQMLPHLQAKLKKVYIRVQSHDQVDEVKKQLLNFKGSSPVSVYVEETKQYINLSKAYQVSVSNRLMTALQLQFGKESVVIKERTI
ncbi:DNA polymerase III subunit alpha [Carnobacteriaceae bacterium zg-ZUI240]|nr:DNA polymerase III subunit alpha [Carnobacteriaceae bacterium zg-ZUI240]